MTLPDLRETPLAIRLFGPLEVRTNGARLPRLRSRKGGWLLALLALRHGQRVERDWLAGLLWPESGQSQAYHCLRVTLTDLRRALGAAAGRLQSPTFHTLSLDLTGAEVDLVAFHDALQRGDPASLEQAVTLYRGPLLEGCAEEWAFQERLVHEQAYLGALEKLAAVARTRGQAGDAERWLRMALAAEPLRESAHRELMGLLADRGDYAAALLAYRELRSRLHRELNTEPEPGTQAHFEQLRAQARARASAGRPAPAMTGPPLSTIASGLQSGSNGPAPSTSSWWLPGEAGPHEARRAAEACRMRFGDDRNGFSNRALLPGSAQDDGRASHRLPAPLTRFFGRQVEIARLSEWLRDPATRLVTLTGPGGSGKTRLAQEAGRALGAAYNEGAPPTPFVGGPWFVPLLDLSDARLIPGKLLQSLGLQPSPHTEPLEQVAAALLTRPSLLILDNFEQLVEDGASYVQSLLDQAPSLTILVTSRQSLGVPGEREFPVGPLPVPVDGSGLIVDGPAKTALSDPSPITHQLSTLLACPSVALFVDRAQAVRPDFTLSATNAAAAARLCRRLEWIPLAIELAAARVRVLTPAQMLDRLEAIHPLRGNPPSGGARFELLSGRQRGTNPRHRSLRATLDWSYQLLSPELQRFFARLSVFRGGWTLEAAAAVSDPESATEEAAPGAVGSGSPDAARALDFLEELQQCSLVITDPATPVAGGGEQMRYRLLETLREYGWERLTAEEQRALAQRHLDYYRSWIEQRWPVEVGGIDPYLDSIEPEHDNLRTALDWMIRSGAALDWLLTTWKTYHHFIPVLSYFWMVRGYTSEGRARLAEILSWPGAAAPTKARAWLLLQRAAPMALQQGDFDAAGALVQESLSIYEQLGEKWGAADCCEFMAGLARDQGDYPRAYALYEQVLTRAHEAGNERWIARTLSAMGYTANLNGDGATGQRRIEDGLQMLRKRLGAPADYADYVGLTIDIAWACSYLGEIADGRGDHGVADDYLKESVANFLEAGRLFDAASARQKLGRVAQHQEQWGAAAAHFSESLAFWQQDGHRAGIAACLVGLAAVAAGQGEPERAARVLSGAVALRESRGIPVPPVERPDLDRLIAQVRGDLEETAFAAAWAAGQALPIEQVITEALQELPAG